ncbi:hypothetical protein [Nesterenkonia ebinurensis]|uniref:hypothetical protein n=1 Tax=Nesterenkonia ebinurensis TaxID=2608252 RepID=UPI00123D6A9E|nr:hypothetical protein [Nesterenkonia ebinurensis]
MNSLTSRYVEAVLRHVPESNREDIGQEISAAIAEMIDARLADAQSPGTQSAAPADVAAAERSVLEELGDPRQLSYQYTQRPRHLIGPELYPVYIRGLQWLLPIVGVLALLAALLVNGIVYSVTDPEPQIGALIGRSLGAAAGTTVLALLIAFAAITIGLAVFERLLPAGGFRELSGQDQEPWTVEHLDPVPAQRTPVRVESIIGLVLLALLASVPALPTTLFYIGHLNNGETFINPDLPMPWLLGYWSFLAVLAAVEVWTLNGKRPLTLASTGVRIAADALLASYLTAAVLTQQVLHPDLAAHLDLPAGVWIVLAGIWAITLWDQISTIRAYRADRTLPAQDE